MKKVFLLGLLAFALAPVAPAHAGDDAMRQLQDAASKSDTGTTALGDDRAKSWSNEGFDGNSPTAATPDDQAMKVQAPTAAAPNE